MIETRVKPCLLKLSVAFVAGLVAGWPAPAAAQDKAVAVAAFDYSDSSGEPQDQSAAHEARVADFRERLSGQLEASRQFRPARLGCLGTDACSAATMSPETLTASAKAAGADLLVFGSIHKMSTLVGWGRVDVLDLGSGRIVFDRVLSFRGDSDDAFAKAADFAAKDIVRTLGPAASSANVAGRGIR